jgi:glycolate oxidase FAD binding subunit
MNAGASEQVESLCDALESDLWRRHPKIEIDGRPFDTTLCPRNEVALSRVLAELSRQKLAALIRGGGSRMAFGNLPSAGDVLLSTEGLCGVRAFEADDGVVEAFAGTRLGELREAIRGSGWELPFDCPGSDSSLGGCIATATPGPRSLGFGPVRRSVLGLQVTLANGDRTRCGGRVVKNVTGYDLGKLYTGSLGSLGVITSAWLRLHPSPQRVAVRCAEFSESALAFQVGVEASRRSSVRACTLMDPELARHAGLPHSLAASWVLLIELAGEDEECSQDIRWLDERVDLVEPQDEAGDPTDRVRDLLSDPSTGEGVRARLAVLPSALETVCTPLRAARARLLVHPGIGLVYCEFPQAEGREGVRESIATVRSAARTARGSALLEALPTWAKQDVDVFDDCGNAMAVMRKIKTEFDPTGVLNPGRFAGRL